MAFGLPRMVAGAGGGLWNGALGAAPAAPPPAPGLDIDPADLAGLFPKPSPSSLPPYAPANPFGRLPGDLSMDVRTYRDPLTGYIHYENGLDPTPPPPGWKPGQPSTGSPVWSGTPGATPNLMPSFGSPVSKGLEMLPDGRYWRPEGPGDVPSSGNMVDMTKLSGFLTPGPRPPMGAARPMPFPGPGLPAPCRRPSPPMPWKSLEGSAGP
jgi:hypothetical protein